MKTQYTLGKRINNVLNVIFLYICLCYLVCKNIFKLKKDMDLIKSESYFNTIKSYFDMAILIEPDV